MQRYPDRFFMFFQNDDPAAISDGLVRTLELSEDPQWRDAVVTAFDVRGEKYKWTSELLDIFDESVRRYLAELPDIARRISELVYS